LDGQVTSLSGAMPIHLPWNDVGASGIAIIVNAFFPTGFILRDARVSASLRVESSRLFTNNELIDSELDGTPEVWGGVQLGGVVRMEESLTILNGLLSDCACAGIAPTDQVLVFGEGVDQFEIACDPNITINDSRCLPADGALCNSLSTLCGFAPALPSLGIIDVDTNGNGSPDAVSVGMRLTLVGATLASPPVAPNICGDGVLAAPETCDDGNGRSGDGCTSFCRVELCGDGAVQSVAGENCDDGNTLSEDGCSSACEAEFCGDGVAQTALGEACDDGNNSDGDGCTARCIVETCGNGRLETVLGENCDDGNGYDGDNCSSACSICVDDAGEPDSLLSARNINPISCAVGSLNLDGLVAQSGNPDYFTFILPVGSSIVSSLQSDAEGVSFDLLDSAGSIIQAGVGSGTMLGLVELNYLPTDIVGGSFVLRANAEAAAECIAYSISICTNRG
jgi:cysteine-rich repeat protein